MPPDETHFVNVGLTAQEAEARLGKFGPNEPAATQQRSFRSDLLHQFTNPLVLILIIVAIASASLGEKVVIPESSVSFFRCMRPLI